MGSAICIRDRVQVLARDLPFVPQVFPAAAVEPALHAFYRSLHRPWVHVAQHQNLAGVDVLGNGQHQSRKSELGQKGHYRLGADEAHVKTISRSSSAHSE